MTRARDLADTQDNLGGAVPPFVAGKNPVINSGMDIWQRGTSVAITNSYGYTADRWFIHSTAAPVTISRQNTNDTTNLPNIQYCARVQRNSGSTATGEINVANLFETVNSIPFAGKTVTLSFYARAGANFSYSSNILNARIQTGTGTDENLLLSGYTGSFVAIEADATLTTTWQRFSFTATLATNIKEMCVYLYGNGVGTAGANDYYEITGVQVEVGSVATPYSRNTGTIQGELAACQRYYWRSTVNGNNNQVYGGGFAASTTTIVTPFSLPVQMRTAPTVIGYANIYATDETTNFTPSAVVANSRTSVNILQIQATVTGATAYRPYLIVANGTAGSFIDASAEL